MPQKASIATGGDAESMEFPKWNSLPLILAAPGRMKPPIKCGNRYAKVLGDFLRGRSFGKKFAG